jgi:hypothetical protein
MNLRRPRNGPGAVQHARDAGSSILLARPVPGTARMGLRLLRCRLPSQPPHAARSPSPDSGGPQGLRVRRAAPSLGGGRLAYGQHPPAHTRTPRRPAAAAADSPIAPSFGGTRVDVLDSRARHRHADRRADEGLPPFDQVGSRSAAAPVDYERLRITWELTRDIGLERDLDKLLDKILLASSSS